MSGFHHFFESESESEENQRGHPRYLIESLTSWSHIPQVHPLCTGGGDEERVECQRNQSYLSHRRIPSLHLLQQVRMLLNPRKYMPESSLRIH